MKYILFYAMTDLVKNATIQTHVVYFFEQRLVELACLTDFYFYFLLTTFKTISTIYYCLSQYRT